MRFLSLCLLLCALLGVASPVNAEADKTPSRQAFFQSVMNSVQDEKNKETEKRPRRERLSSPSGRDASSREAAAMAEQRYGGKALAVIPFRDGYRVRLLLEGGRVTTVTIKD